ncbi:MAG: aconitate hydratase AcnA, partial [Candidatus Dadabacteria bacterium]
MEKDPFGARSQLKVEGVGEVTYYKLSALEDHGLGSLDRLPYCIRVLLESALRNYDGKIFTEEHVRTLMNWGKCEPTEVPYKPARVLLQDFTGVPALVDLAAMRDAIRDLGGDPKLINPLVRGDLVIDHSVQIDYAGAPDAFSKNEEKEFQRNKERYEFLKWGKGAFKNLRVVPPSTGIVHQVNLEYLSEGVYLDREKNVVYPDSCIGTDSHTPTVNGIGVLAWGVGGIEAEAVMLGQPMFMLVPEVIGIKLIGSLQEGVTATDLVLRITELCREVGVVGKFVEFFGSGLKVLSASDRATIGNMAPEQGSTVSFFPVDQVTINYLRNTGRSDEIVALAEAYYKEQGLFRSDDSPVPDYTKTIELDLATIEPSIAGPKRPHDRIPLKTLKDRYAEILRTPQGPQGVGLKEEDIGREVVITLDGKDVSLRHGSVVIAAITSCTNTSNPSVMMAAGLVAKKAVERGLTVKPYVKTSLAPGSQVVTEYLLKAGLMEHLERLGFHVVAYGCTTCIGNSGPLRPEVEAAIREHDLVVSAVLSGNRNFEGRVHPLTQTNFLASPPLVVAFAIAGTTDINILVDPIGEDKNGDKVYLRDIWPSTKEIITTIRECITVDMYRERYGNIFEGSKAWKAIASEPTDTYSWRPDSTYIRRPPFFDGITFDEAEISPIEGARVLGVFGDSVTTDHISPAGVIASDSPAAEYLRSHGVQKSDFNSYGSRRGNDEVMVRGTFANIRIRNKLVPGKEGNCTVYHP